MSPSVAHGDGPQRTPTTPAKELVLLRSAHGVVEHPSFYQLQALLDFHLFFWEFRHLQVVRQGGLDVFGGSVARTI